MTAPFVSLIIPVYQSHQTLAECLRRIRAQTYGAFEVIVVDSDPSPEAHRSVVEQFPQIRYVYSPMRLLPHAARNYGVGLAAGQLLAFTDPDIYLPPNWLADMVNAYCERRGVIVSALVCYDNRWLDNGAHFCKFDSWLPGGPVRQIDVGPTAGLLCERAALEQVGGFEGEHMLADTLISWAFTEAGIPLWFWPSIVAFHHHYSDWPSIVRERFARGREFGFLRIEHGRWRNVQILRHSLISLIIPLRLVGLVWRVFRNAARAHLALSFIWHSPVVVSGEAAWLAGETAAYLSVLARRGRA